ncbi:MAG TPA: hypothetical protein PLD47_09190 [Aggregatilineales bacterium]|nr:hypothetical protein [Anaerolineales bacterium]HRE47889.1 hypothetical protein [Aggregatilineales bacterium]
MTTPTPTFERIDETLTLERLHDGEILIFTFHAPPSKDAVDRWYDTIVDYVTIRNTTDRWLVYDLTKPGIETLTPYGRQRLREAANKYPNATGRAAVIVPRNNPTFLLVRGFLLVNSIRQYRKLIIQMYNERENGLAWVLDGLQKRRQEKARKA